MSVSTLINQNYNINISIFQLEYFVNCKIEACDVYVKIFFGDQLVKNFSKIQIEEVCTNVNLECQLEFLNIDEAIDNILTKPLRILVCDVTEVSTGKEKKKSDEKLEISSTLAQSNIDLLPLIRGTMRLRENITLKIPLDSPYEAEFPIPALDFEAIWSNEVNFDIHNSNIMSITLGSLFSLPDSWTTNGQAFSYTAALSLPRNFEKENVATFYGGKFLKPDVDEEINDMRKKWPISQEAEFAKQCISKENYAEESGDLRSCMDTEFRSQAYTKRPRVMWNILQRSYLDFNGNNILREQICKNQYWPMQIYRTGLSESKIYKRKSDVSDDVDVSFHGVAYIDMAPLLYPGVTRFCGVYKVYAYSESNIELKTDKSGKKLTNIGVKIAPSVTTINTALTKSIKKDEKSIKSDKKSVSSKESTAEIKELIDKDDGKEYESAISYVFVEIDLMKPLVRKRELSELLGECSSLIPPREKIPKKTNSAEKAVADFKEQICHISNQLFQDYVSKFSNELTTNIPKDELYEQQRQELIYELNASGKYLVFKERLKHSIIKIVREKYLKIQNFQDRGEFQKFLADLFVFLIDEMHHSTRQFTSQELDEGDVVVDPVTDDQLKLFACEAAANSNYSQAAYYLKERIARKKDKPDYWLDYGVHLLYLDQFEKAEECFKEAISIDQSYLNGLLLLGLVNALLGRSSQAKLFLDLAVEMHPCNINAWVIFGLFYNYVGNEAMLHMSMVTARRLEAAEKLNSCRANSGSGDNSGQSSPRKTISSVDDVGQLQQQQMDGVGGEGCDASIFLKPIEFLLDHSVMPFVELALASYLTDPLGGMTYDYYMYLAQIHIHKKELSEAELCVNSAIQLQILNSNAWALHGHVKLQQGAVDAAAESYERSIQFETEPRDIHMVLMKLAAIYLDKSWYEKAKQTYIKVCKSTPTALSWLGVGISCFRLCELDNAEDALIEANTLDRMNGEVWGYLCLISLQRNRKVEAEQAYKYAIQRNLTNCSLLTEIQNLQQCLKFGNPEL